MQTGQGIINKQEGDDYQSKYWELNQRYVRQ